MITSRPCAAAQGLLTPATNRDKRVIRKWQLPGDPRGVAVGPDGTIYVGLATRQSIVAIDPKAGAIRQEVVLDSVDIASTKELVTVRLDSSKKRLLIANGSDESATILGIPDLRILREITIEGEPIRDIIADPAGRYLYVLGRSVHVYDIDGERELKTIELDDPMAVTTNAAGSFLVIVASEQFESGKATIAAIFDPVSLKEIDRRPLQTDRRIDAATLGAGDRALVIAASDWLAETTVESRPARNVTRSKDGIRLTFDFGDLISSQQICLPEHHGPQTLLALPDSNLIVFPERRCSASETFTASARKTVPTSLYGINAYALAWDPLNKRIVATDRAGTLTLYKLPR
ncbi:MAG TPA: hypothetical protein VHL58_06910 [Thermoanaerobaculia bacterium]|nr:hypothetical protein [Thermoanaerobaculia bacterium]